MDRHNQLHKRWRVELPWSLGYPELSSLLNYRHYRRRFSPGLGALLGMVSFLGGGFAVIATASLLALRIQ